jgi:anti-sigma factor RsiW
VSVSRELLMRYHDGEVSEEEALFVARALEHEPALLEELGAYRELGSFVRVFAEQRLQQPFDISERVMRAIEPPRARVHSLVPRLVTWVSLGAAIAAGSVLVARSWSAPPAKAIAAHTGSAGESAELLPRSSSSAAPEVSAALEEEPKPPPATIESVDFGANTGTVFVVSTDSSDTPVVWMPDDEDDEDRSESL